MGRKSKGLTGFVLKVVAILGMTSNHVAHAVAGIMPLDVTLALFSFGGLTFPVMSFLLVEGYRHTSSLRNYAMRLLLFAILAQVPFTLCFGWGDIQLGQIRIPTLNVLFTLLVSLGLIRVFDRVKNQLLCFAALLAALGVSSVCDWALSGPIITLLFFLLRRRGKVGILLAMAFPYIYVLLPSLSVLTGAVASSIPQSQLIDIAGVPLQLAGATVDALANTLYAGVGFTLALVAMCLYNGRRGKPMKWFFYGYYPAHLIVIWAVRTLLVS